MAASVEGSKAMTFASGKSDTQALPMDEDDDSRRADESCEDITDNEKSAVSSADESGTKSDGEENSVKKPEKAIPTMSAMEKCRGNGELLVPLDTNAAEVVKSDGLRRERKQVERFAHIPVKHEEKSTVIVPGSGSKLGDITYIAEQIHKRNANDLANLHRFFYDRRGTTALIKKNLRLFSGFSFEEVSPEYSKKKKQIDKWSTKIIRDICDVLGLLKKGTKEQQIERIMEFCLNPTDSGLKATPKSKTKKASSASSKSKKSPSKSKKSKTTPKTDSTKPKKGKGTKRKLDLSDESGDGVEEDKAGGKESKSKVKEPSAKKMRDGPSRKASEGKTYLEDDEVEKFVSDTGSDFSSEEEKKKPKKVKAPVKSKASAPSNKKSQIKNKLPSKQPPESNVNNSDSKNGETSVDTKKSTKKLSDDDLKKSIQKILGDADLKKLSMRMVMDQLFEEYPGVDLQDKKSFIKSVVQEML